MSSTEQPTVESKGMFEAIWESVFTPGMSPQVVLFMNMSFIALFVTLFVLAILTEGNLHVLLLLILSVTLFATVQWFVLSCVT